MKGLFGQYGTIENHKIFPGRAGLVGDKKAFVCFSTPESAYLAKSNLNGQIHGSKPLIVVNYEDPNTIKKMKHETQDRNDFFNYRRSLQANTPIDPTAMAKPEVMQLL